MAAVHSKPLSERLEAAVAAHFIIRFDYRLDRYVWSNLDGDYGGSSTELGDLLDCIDRHLSLGRE